MSYLASLKRALVQSGVVLSLATLPGTLFASGSAQAAFCEAEAEYLNNISHLNKPNRHRQARSYDCFVGLGDNAPLPEFIIDIRPAAEFERVRIPGSLNIPPYALRHSTFLEGRQVLLVDQGVDRQGLGSLCYQLQAAGHRKVTILAGGLSAWHASGRELVGSDGDKQSLSEIQPRSFVMGQEGQTLAVLASSATVTDFQANGLWPEKAAVLDSFADNYAELTAQLVALSGGGFFPVVLLGDDADLKERRQIAARHQNVFYLAQSAHDVARFVQENKRIVARRGEVPERFKCSG